MKLTYEAYSETVTIETLHDDIILDDMVGYVKRLLLAAGFQENSIDEYFCDDICETTNDVPHYDEAYDTDNGESHG